MQHKIHKNMLHGENGFAIYLVLGFILLMTTSLTMIGQHLTQQNKAQFQAVIGQKLIQRAHMSLQLGLLEIRGETTAIAADELGYRLPAGLNDSDLNAHRHICLTGRGSYNDTNADDFLSSKTLTSQNIKNRYFLHDASNGTTPRKFEIYGCAIKGTHARLAYGVWVFDSTTQTFDLVKTEMF